MGIIVEHLKKSHADPRNAQGLVALLVVALKRATQRRPESILLRQELDAALDALDEVMLVNSPAAEQLVKGQVREALRMEANLNRGKA